MHILLSNDDGVLAPGLLELATALAEEHRVTVVAPEGEESAKSHALTIKLPLFLSERSKTGSNPHVYALSGTPTDCAKFALTYLLKDDMPDLVISGVNNGFNLGSDALYSGTVGAAMEGLFYGIPGLAVSIEKYTNTCGAKLIPIVKETINRIFINNAYKGFLNMNFPTETSYSWDMIKIVHQGMQVYTDVVEAREDRRGRKYFWIGGNLAFPKEDRITDVWAIKQGYITIVPLTWRQECEDDCNTLATML